MSDPYSNNGKLIDSLESGDVFASIANAEVGLRGETGPQGPIGPQGPQGIQGEQGIQGVQGVPGEVTDAELTAALNLKANIANPTFTGSVVVPAATSATHAAQVTAKDPATGRLAIGNVEIGDTGWRNITSLCDTVGAFSTDNGWQLRRVAHVVYLSCVDSTFKSGVTNGQLLYTLLSGWRGPNSYSPLTFMDLSGGIYSGFFRSFFRAVPSYDVTPWGIKAYETASTPLDGVRMSGTVSWITSDAWPTSLPGTQVTAPLS